VKLIDGTLCQSHADTNAAEFFGAKSMLPENGANRAWVESRSFSSLRQNLIQQISNAANGDEGRAGRVAVQEKCF